MHMQKNFMESCISSNSLSSLRIWALKDQGLQKEAVYLILLVKKYKCLEQVRMMKFKLICSTEAFGVVHEGIMRDSSLS